jgi:hypothetical protein
VAENGNGEENMDIEVEVVEVVPGTVKDKNRERKESVSFPTSKENDFTLQPANMFFLLVTMIGHIESRYFINVTIVCATYSQTSEAGQS